MKAKSQKSKRGNIGLIVLLICLLIVGYLVVRNMKSLGVSNQVTIPTLPGESAQPGQPQTGSPQQIIQKFEQDKKNIEEMQEKR